jgi:predicted AlkP superfamily phosphohydrolase/phosphomutase
MSNKVLIIGLDGATWDVLNPLLEAGKMPNLAELVAGGVSGILESVIPPATAPAWSTFHTGVYPDKHGVYDFVRLDRSSLRPILVNSKTLRVPTIWDIVGAAGKHIASIGLPLTYPPKPLNGILISGPLTPSLDVEFTYPPALKDELLKAVGDYRFVAPTRIFFDHGLPVFLKELIQTEKKRLEAAEHVLRNYEWDVAMVQIQSIDNLQHALWPLLDPSSSEYSRDKWEEVAEFYQVVDTAIGHLRKLAGPAVELILLSDHGFGPERVKVSLNKWFIQQGWLTVRGDSVAKVHLLDFAERLDVFNLRHRLLSRRTRTNLATRLQRTAFDYQSSKVVMHGAVIYILAEGQEYLEIQDRVVKELYGIRDPESGQRVVKHVYTLDEFFRGSTTDYVPDLLIEPSDGYGFSGSVLGNPTELFDRKSYGKNIVGNHRPEGVYIFHGGFAEKFRSEQRLHIVDIPAIILELLGIGRPGYFDSRFVHSVRSQREEYKRAYRDADADVFSEEEQEQIEDRLRQLGYL